MGRVVRGRDGRTARKFVRLPDYRPCPPCSTVAHLAKQPRRPFGGREQPLWSMGGDGSEVHVGRERDPSPPETKLPRVVLSRGSKSLVK